MICALVVFTVNEPWALPLQEINGIAFGGTVMVNVPELPLSEPDIVIGVAVVMPAKPTVPVNAFPFCVIIQVIVPSGPTPIVPVVGMPSTEPLEPLVESADVPTQVPVTAPPVEPLLPEPDAEGA